NYMILARSWNLTTEQLDPYVVIENQAAGRRYDGIPGTGWSRGGGVDGIDPNRYFDRIRRLKANGYEPDVDF
ncbi:hypothetical protein R3P93_24335, partial [Rhodococcus cerastii]